MSPWFLNGRSPCPCFARSRFASSLAFAARLPSVTSPGSASAAARAFAATSSAAATSSGTGGCDAAGDGRTIGFRSAGAAGFTLLVNDALAVPDDDRRRARRIVTEVAPPRIARLASVLLLVLGERAITLVIPQARPWPGRECSIDRVARFFSRLQHYLVGDAGLREWRLTLIATFGITAPVRFAASW